jgi:hypothetical protein
MMRMHRPTTTIVLIVCLLGTTSSKILFASDDASSSRAGSASPSADSRPTANEVVSAISATVATPGTQLPGTSEFVRSVMEPSPLVLARDTLATRSLTFAPDAPSGFAQRGYRGRGYSGRRNGAAAAVILGAAAAIAGTAVLVYANRPECSTIPTATGCGYGTKVVGGAVVSAGVVGLVVGAAMWR